MSDQKHPGTAGLLPVKGSGCGIRPDPDALNDDTGFDFSGARSLLEKQQKASGIAHKNPDADETRRADNLPDS